MTDPLRPRPDPTHADSALRLPDFLILGEMKCGSTTLWELLGRDPRISLSTEKELHFFNARPDKPAATLSDYAAHFAAARPDQLAGEATPNYLFDVAAADRIRQQLPRARLVAILRDPVPRAWSHYWHNVRRGREPLGFEQALAAEPERMRQGAEARLHFSYVSRGHYVRSLEAWAERFGRDALLVVLLEDLTTRPAEVVARVLAHLGLAGELPDLSAAPPQRNRASFPRWPALDRVTRALRRSVAGRPLLAGPVLALGRLTRPLRTYSGQPQLAPDVRHRLRAAFEESDRALAQWLSRELPWRRAEPGAAAATRHSAPQEARS